MHSDPVVQNLSRYSMGVNQLSKKLRPTDKTPDTFAKSEIINGKTIGVDVSVVLHKGLGTDKGAGQYIVRPKVINSEVVDKCTRLCGYANANNIILKISFSGLQNSKKSLKNSKSGQNNQNLFLKTFLLLRYQKNLDFFGQKSKN